jgi:pentapeptide repeat protein
MSQSKQKQTDSNTSSNHDREHSLENASHLAPLSQRPSTDDRGAWRKYWISQHQPWRTEPEIDEERQHYLSQRLVIQPDIEHSIYPFKDIQLSRADVEWLLINHENGRGPVSWNDESQRRRDGLDLRGADLRQVDLSHLPLARILGGLTWDEWDEATGQQRSIAAVRMQEANLRGAHLEGARFRGAHLEGANLKYTYLAAAQFRYTHFERANLGGAFLDRTDLYRASISDEKGVGPSLLDVHWGDANLFVMKWSQVAMLGDEYEARQESHHGKLKDKAARLEEYEASVRANRQVAAMLQAQGMNEDAARFAYRAQVLQRIVLRLQAFQPQVSLWQRVLKLSSYAFSLFLDLLAGYGFQPAKTTFWYLFVISCFATAYAFFGHLSPFPDAVVFSFMSFHGRGFFPSLSNETNLHNPLVGLAAAEAVTGLFIEISFIATFTKRFYGG